MAADESEALLDGGEQRLLAGGRHRGIFVGAGLREVAGGEEEDGLVVVKILGVKDAAVFGARDVEAVLGAEFGDGRFGNAELAILPLDYLVFEAGGFGEDEQRFSWRGDRWIGERQAGGRRGQSGGGQGAQKLAAIGTVRHVYPRRR